MKIVHVVDHFNEKEKSPHPPKAYIEKLKMRGYETAVYTSTIDINPTKSKKMNQEIIVSGICRFRSLRLFGKAFFPGVISKILFSKNPDLMFSYVLGSFSSFVAGYLKKVKGYKLIHIADFDVREPIPSIIKKPYTILYRILPAKQADLVIVFTLKQKEELVRRYGFKREKIEVIPIGIDSKKFISKTSRNVRKELSLQKKFVLLNASHIVRKKNIQFILRTLSKINDERVVLLHTGKTVDTKYKEELMKLIKSCNLERRVFFQEAVHYEDMKDYYYAADLFIQSSFKESFCIPVLEAMASSLPVISTSTGIAPYVVKNGITGFIVKNEEELKQKINFLMNNPDILKKMRINCKDTARKYDWEIVIDEAERVIKKIIKD